MENTKSKVPVVLKQRNEDAHQVKALPTATGSYPYRLPIENLIGSRVRAIQDSMFFHLVGDTGSVRHSAFQKTVASTLTKQLEQSENTPSFLFHLGDIVYNYGEAQEYPAQFLQPYDQYQAPIFAIAGNHDGDINPEASSPYQSLDAFMDVFCDTHSRPIQYGARVNRQSMIQPHVYWTLETPVARFIGLYANVTKHGYIDTEQRDWFIEELRDAALQRDEQAILVCVHHAPYSADTNHGSSSFILDFLEDAFAIAGVLPDAVCSGHVHNYQRFHKTYADGSSLPFIVAGAGGYADLHSIASEDSTTVMPLALEDADVRLMAYCDDRFGFLKMGITRCTSGFKLVGAYYTLSSPEDQEASLYDSFEIPLRRELFSPQFSDLSTDLLCSTAVTKR